VSFSKIFVLSLVKIVQLLEKLKGHLQHTHTHTHTHTQVPDFLRRKRRLKQNVESKGENDEFVIRNQAAWICKKYMETFPNLYKPTDI
jgi:hypothetical protein